MRNGYKLVFDCCGNEIPLGRADSVGMHDEFCLACDTENPETRVEREVIT